MTTSEYFSSPKAIGYAGSFLIVFELHFDE